MTNTSKARGTAFETDVLKYLRVNGYDAEKLRTVGRFDEGDIIVKIGGMPFVLECKAQKAMDLSGWVKEAAVEAVNYAIARKVQPVHFAVVHKRRGVNASSAYVTTPLYEWLGQVSE